MIDNVDVTGLARVSLLKALYKRACGQDLSDTDTAKALDDWDRLIVREINGVVMRVNLESNMLHTGAYNRMYGPGAAEAVVAEMRAAL